jgi:hypothetical protein
LIITYLNFLILTENGLQKHVQIQKDVFTNLIFFEPHSMGTNNYPPQQSILAAASTSTCCPKRVGPPTLVLGPNRLPESLHQTHLTSGSVWPLTHSQPCSHITIHPPFIVLPSPILPFRVLPFIVLLLMCFEMYCHSWTNVLSSFFTCDATL